MSLTESERAVLLTLAKDSILYGLKTGGPLKINPETYPETLRAHRATFVTLERHGELRGCIGMLEPVRPLAEDVAENAYSAAFCDRRFLPLADYELADLDLHISILSPATEISFSSESDLMAQLRPNIDGLILKEGLQRATFLPSVWESLQTPEQFLRYLKQKAGFPANYWSDTIKAYRYTTESIGKSTSA